MTDRPVIFSAPMVLALLAGRKTMTRRLAWKPSRRAIGVLTDPKDREANPSPWQCVQPGDRLWVKETFVCYHTKEKVYLRGPKIDVEWVYYRASDGHAFVDEMKWESSMYMPRKLSRLTLVVTATKIERLQEITNASCIAEGAEIEDVPGGSPDGQPMVRIDGKSWHHQTVRLWYHRLWDTLHGEGAWDENPEVVVVSFTVHKQNIDAIAEAA